MIRAKLEQLFFNPFKLSSSQAKPQLSFKERKSIKSSSLLLSELPQQEKKSFFSFRLFHSLTETLLNFFFFFLLSHLILKFYFYISSFKAERRKLQKKYNTKRIKIQHQLLINVFI